MSMNSFWVSTAALTVANLSNSFGAILFDTNFSLYLLGLKDYLGSGGTITCFAIVLEGRCSSGFKGSYMRAIVS